MGNHAIVFGATGIQGWAVVNEILNGYPSKDAFGRVTATANRPLTDNVLWPKSDKLQVVTGINLLNEKGQDGLEQTMREQVPHIDTVTHLFYSAYIADMSIQEEIAVNVKMLERAVSAVESLSKNLKFVVLFTGTKAYGIVLGKDFPFADKLPLSEDLPRTPEPFASENFYYHQCDRLAQLAEGKPWTWCELRPDVIIGFVPNNNFYCVAQLMSTYLALYRETHGEGAECPFPGTSACWNNMVSNDSSQDIIARFSIHCALHPDVCGKGQAFNISDNSEPAKWNYTWPVICEYFGLKGTPPPEGSEVKLGKFLIENLDQWREVEKRYGLETGRVANDRSLVDFQQILVSSLDFDRRVDLSKCHQAWNTDGKAEEVDRRTAWWTAFDRFRKARIIP